jgi:outer membrane protein OmpA-like peptidoglycan-associated protein
MTWRHTVKTGRHRLFGIAGAAALGLACLSTAPSPELKTARDAVKNAQGSDIPAQDLASAQRALQAAEKYHDQAPGSNEERSQAYIATRRIQLGQAKARQRRTVLARAQLAPTDNSQMATLEQTRRALEEARQDAADARRELRALQASETSGLTLADTAGIRFETASAELSPEAKGQLDALAQELSQQPDQMLIVHGYADARGDSQYNRALSQRRANAVRDSLVSRGVAAEQLRAVGLGESYPIATNATPEGRAENRRVELAMAPPISPSTNGRSVTPKPSYPEPERQPVSGKDTDTNAKAKAKPRQPDGHMPAPEPPAPE